MPDMPNSRHSHLEPAAETPGQPGIRSSDSRPKRREHDRPVPSEAYGETTVNYNRDVEIFPVLNTIFEKIYGESPYKSPTDMGVNMAGNCICDDEACREASKQEIIRRYYAALNALAKGESFGQGGAEDRAAHESGRHYGCRPESSGRSTERRAKETGGPAAALELEDGRIITGKTTKLLGASAALLLNVLKAPRRHRPREAHHLAPVHRADPEAEGGLPKEQKPASAHR